MQDDQPDIPGEGTARRGGGADVTGLLPTRRMSSTDLFAGSREIEIDHNGRKYRLRITQTGKLILTA